MNKFNSNLPVKKLVFIVNLAAKNGFSRKVWYNIERKFRAIQHSVYYTEKTGHAAMLAKKIAESTKDPLIIIAVGGDGTIHEVLNGAHPYDHITFGFIPTGSGNDFARGFKVPIKPDVCMEYIIDKMHGTGNQFDIGCYGGENTQGGYFVNSIGAGFDAVVSQRANKSPLKKWLNYLSLGNLIYALYLLLEIFRYRPSKLELIIDHKKHIFEKTWFVTVSNQPYYGGGMQIAPNADPQDGKFSIIIVHQLSKWKLLFVFMSVFWGGHLKFKEVAEYKGENIIIQFNDPVAVHADGENIGETPLDVRINSKKWTLI